jgi:hypothetical protein
VVVHVKEHTLALFSRGEHISTPWTTGAHIWASTHFTGRPSNDAQPLTVRGPVGSGNADPMAGKLYPVQAVSAEAEDPKFSRTEPIARIGYAPPIRRDARSTVQYLASAQGANAMCAWRLRYE